MGFKSFKSYGSKVAIPNIVIPLHLVDFTPNTYALTGRTSDNYQVYSFTSTVANYYSISYKSSFEVPLNILAIGGGGGGASFGGGGAGAGGLSMTTVNLPAGEFTISLSIGAGGVGAGVNSGSGTQGQNTSITFAGNSSLNILSGGGSGGCAKSTPVYTQFGSGGGGGSSGGTTNPTIANTNGGIIFANNGSSRADGSNAGGGGGAGKIGSLTNGGDGLQCPLDGIKNFNPSGVEYGTYYWGGGGGGGMENSTFLGRGGLGGGGGGGNASNPPGAGGNGLNNGESGVGFNGKGGDGGINTGGGGGGNWTQSVGGTGGSGIILMSFLSKPIVYPYSFRIKARTLTTPTTEDTGKTLTNNGNVSIVNDPVRGFVFNMERNYLSINLNKTIIEQTRTFWVSSSNPSGNTFSSDNFLIFFQSPPFLTFLPSGFNVKTTTSQTSTWVFYSVSLTATSIAVYVNGNLFQRVNGSWGGENNPIQFGAFRGGNAMLGLLDDMRLYEYALSDSEILDIYNSTV